MPDYVSEMGPVPRIYVCVCVIVRAHTNFKIQKICGHKHLEKGSQLVVLFYLSFPYLKYEEIAVPG